LAKMQRRLAGYFDRVRALFSAVRRASLNQDADADADVVVTVVWLRNRFAVAVTLLNCSAGCAATVLNGCCRPESPLGE
jgi:hypothetical protein